MSLKIVDNAINADIIFLNTGWIAIQIVSNKNTSDQKFWAHAYGNPKTAASVFMAIAAGADPVNDPPNKRMFAEEHDISGHWWRKLESEDYQLWTNQAQNRNMLIRYSTSMEKEGAYVWLNMELFRKYNDYGILPTKLTEAGDSGMAFARAIPVF